MTISSGTGIKTMMEERARSTETPSQVWRYIPLDTGLKESARILYVPVTVHREQGVKKEYQQDATI